jgi:hypothetical protein
MSMIFTLFTRADCELWTKHLQRSAAVLALCFSAAGCGDSGATECISLPETCTPSFNTDFDTIYRNVLSQRCGTTSGSLNCHGPAGNQGNLNLGDPESAYSALLGTSGPHARVIARDPECSMLMERLETDDQAKRMPRGEAKLAEGARCAIQRWIAEGAVR